MKHRIFLAVISLLLICSLLVGCKAIFSGLLNVTYETNTYPVEGSFTKIEIDTRMTDVTFARAEDGGSRVVCEEPEELHHTVKVENETLKITLEGKKDFSFYTKDMTMVVYLPATDYESLQIGNSTGAVRIPSGYSFGELKITLSTGKIDLKEISAKTIDLEVSTGKITAEKIDCSEAISVQTSTGNATLTDVTCKALNSTGSTGNLELCDVVASESFNLKRSTGNIRFARCDAGAITVETSTGKVVGTLRSDKIFIAKSSTGSINVPETISGGVCKITTSTGKIEIEIEK